MKLAFAIALMLFVTAAATAQPSLKKPMNALVTALNSRTPSVLRPYLSKRFHSADLTDDVAREVIEQFVSGYSEHVTGYEIKESVPLGNADSVHVRLRFGSRYADYGFIFEHDGKFIDIAMFTLSPESRSMYATPENLELPDEIRAPFEVVNGLILVSADLDRVSGTWVLDNGAPYLVLNSTMVSPEAASDKDAGVGINSFSWQGYRSRNHTVLSMDLRSLEKETGRPIAGLIGFTVLRPYELTLDYEHGLLRMVRVDEFGIPVIAFDSSERARWKGTLVMNGHIPVVSFKIGSKKYSMGIDCGAQTNLIHNDVAGRLGSKMIDDGEGMLGGSDNVSAIAKRVLIKDAYLGTMDFGMMQWYISDMKNIIVMPGVKLDGLLGYAFLSRYRLTLNFRAGTVKIF